MAPSDVRSSSQRGASADGGALVSLLLTATGGLALGGGGASYNALKGEIKAAIANDPFDATVATVFGGAFLFYVSEKGHNPKVESYWDALVFISTCLSVGYHDVFARTPAGKAIATAVMTLGSALSGAMLDATAEEKRKAEADAVAVQQAIATTLADILAELKKPKAA